MFETVEKFEKRIADFYGAEYAVATDCCTHAIELCLRYIKPGKITVPANTYISIPFTAMKLGIKFAWENKKWKDYYFLGNTNIIDGAVHFKENGYMPGTFMCLSFQFRKHLNLGRGGMILTDDKQAYHTLLKMRYDGRDLTQPWAEQNIDTIGYHYYMTPETAQLGLDRLDEAIQKQPVSWDWSDYPYLPGMKVF